MITTDNSQNSQPVIFTPENLLKMMRRDGLMPEEKLMVGIVHVALCDICYPDCQEDFNSAVEYFFTEPDRYYPMSFLAICHHLDWDIKCFRYDILRFLPMKQIAETIGRLQSHRGLRNLLCKSRLNSSQ